MTPLYSHPTWGLMTREQLAVAQVYAALRGMVVTLPPPPPQSR